MIGVSGLGAWGHVHRPLVLGGGWVFLGLDLFSKVMYFVFILWLRGVVNPKP